MHVKAFFAGFGGQGVLSMGHLLAHAAMREGRHVTYFPSYGAEVRGGTANCTVAVGDEEIACPIASEPEIVVAMNRPSLFAFASRMGPGGMLFVNTTLAGEEPSLGGADVVRVPATALAAELGESRSANLVMLGAVVGSYPLVGADAVRASIDRLFERKPKAAAANARAFERGLAYAGGKGKR